MPPFPHSLQPLNDLHGNYMMVPIYQPLVALYPTGYAGPSDGLAAGQVHSPLPESLCPQENVFATSTAMCEARKELYDRAPCVKHSIPLLDLGPVQLEQCGVALGRWTDDAVRVSHLAKEGILHAHNIRSIGFHSISAKHLDYVHTLGLSLVGVELMHGAMTAASERLVEDESPHASDRAITAKAVSWAALQLGKLSRLTTALWVQLPPTLFTYENHISDSELGRAVTTVLRLWSISVLTLQANQTDQIERFPRTYDGINRVLASKWHVKTLEFYHPASDDVVDLVDWPFSGLDELLRRHLTVGEPSSQWRSLERLAFMYLEPARLAAPHLLDCESVQRILGGSQLRSLALFFNLPDLSDAIWAFMPLVSGYFDGAMGAISQLLVHAVSHVTFLAQGSTQRISSTIMTAENLQIGQSQFPVAVVHYLPKLPAMAASQRNAMLEHLAVVLPRVRAATLRLPWELCDQSDKECPAVHNEAAETLRAILKKSPDLVRLKLDSVSPPGFSRDVPWYAQALADAGEMPKLRMLSIRTRVTDAERRDHLVRILENNPQLRTLMLNLNDRVVFADGVSMGRKMRASLLSHQYWNPPGSPGAKTASFLSHAGPNCVVRGVFNETVPSVLETCLRTRYEPLMNALRESQIRRIFVRTRLTHDVADENVSKLVRANRNATAAAMERELALLLMDSTNARVETALGNSGVYWHRRLPISFAIESPVDRLFPALSMVPADQGWMSHAKPS